MRRKPLPFAWTLFTAVWLLFPLGFVVQQVLRADLPATELLASLAAISGFVGVFLWLMLRYPFPGADPAPWDLRIRVGLLLALVALALYVELVHSSGVPYRLMYVVIATAVTLPTPQAAWGIAAVTVCAGAIQVSRSGWDGTSWDGVVPFPLVGIGMIVVARLVATVRELRAAREEIARLAVTEERLRFARDLHDLLGRSLSLIALKSELAGRLLPDLPENEGAAREVRDLQGVAREALREVREAVSGYRRPSLEEELAGGCAMLEAAGIACQIHNQAGAVEGEPESILAWAVREGATNVVRHSRAKRCEIRVTRHGGRVCAEVTDDGRRATPEHDSAVGGSGLSGLAERVAGLAGDFEAGPLPEGGFRLRVSLLLGDDASQEAGGQEASSAAGDRLAGEDGRR